jgi:uncharacterized membrane protein
VAENNVLPQSLPSHIEETIQTIARLHADHHQNATPFQRVVDRTTTLLSHSHFIASLAIVVAGWIIFDLLTNTFNAGAVDPLLFSSLGSAASLMSLFMVVLILGTQRREDALAQQREQLILELAIVSEQKTTKVIQLLEEARRDNPLIHNRVDQEAEAMAQPANPQSVLDEIKKTRAAEKVEVSADQPQAHVNPQLPATVTGLQLF